MVGFSSPVRMKEEDDEDEKTSPFYLADQEGRIMPGKFFEQRVVDSIIDREANSVMVMTVPYGRQPLLAEGHDDRIYYAWSEHFLVKVFNSDANYERAIYYPYKKGLLDHDEVINQYDNDRQRRMIRNDDVPDTWPALNSIIVDEQNRLWVSTITDNRDEYDWWVINEDGELKARFTWSRERRLSAVKDDHLYTREINDSGLQQIARYRMEFSDL